MTGHELFDPTLALLVQCPWIAARLPFLLCALELSPQMGLVPLREDPVSGLWEFWVVASGERPDLNRETDQWVITGETGIVLVLLPGGTFTMGAQAGDPDGPNLDPLADEDETPMEVTLAPFFLSKYELTQGQYSRVMGNNPSYLGAEHAFIGDDWGSHPVEQVDWSDSWKAMHRLGLLLPTEAQWEYGARGGTDTRWWTGTGIAELESAANLANQSDNPSHALVGSFPANPYGLHDAIGNVSEWCQDLYVSAAPVPASLNGLRADDVQDSSRFRIYRGGSFGGAAEDARSALRSRLPPGSRFLFLGVRPAARVRD